MRKLSEAMSSLALVVVLALTVLFVGMRLLGLTPYAVLSGSMQPAYCAGDLIYVQKIAPQEIEVGMPITFVANEQLTVVTHRVTGISVIDSAMQPITLEDGTPAVGADGQVLMMEAPLDEPAYYFTTRGDANEHEDSLAVYGKNVLGTPRYRLPFFGHLIIMLRTTSGKVMLACFGALLAILLFLPEMLAALDRAGGHTHINDTNPQEEEDVLINAAQGEDVLIGDDPAP